MHMVSEVNAAGPKAGRLTRRGLGEPTPTDRAKAPPGASEAPLTAFPGKRAAYFPSETTERDRGPSMDTRLDKAADPPGLSRAEFLYAAARRAIRERPAREAALVAAWGEEWVENPVYPEGPEGGGKQ